MSSDLEKNAMVYAVFFLWECQVVYNIQKGGGGGGEVKLRKKVRKCVVQDYNYFATHDIFETIGLI